MAACSVESCDRKSKGHGLCPTHLARWRKTGVMPTTPIRVWKRLPVVCQVPGCDTPPLARGWCSAHYNAWWNHGDPLANLQRAAIPTYSGLHDRLCRLKTGKCITPGCNGSKTEMALIHGQGNLYDSGRGLMYSLDPAAYQEMCTTCHKRYDGIAANLGVEPGTRECSIVGCVRPHLARGYCGLHYKRTRATTARASREAH